MKKTTKELEDYLEHIKAGFITHDESEDYVRMSQDFMRQLSSLKTVAFGYDIMSYHIERMGLDIKIWRDDFKEGTYNKRMVEMDFEAKIRSCLEYTNTKGDHLVTFQKTSSRNYERVFIRPSDLGNTKQKAFLYAYAESVLKKDLKAERLEY